jgi:hypothetical protein
MRESGLRGMAWVPVEAKGARLSGGAGLAEPGGQRVEALGGNAVVLCGAKVGGAAVGGFAGAAKAITEAAPNNNPERLANICFMAIHRISAQAIRRLALSKLDPLSHRFRALLHSSIWVAGEMLSSG